MLKLNFSTTGADFEGFRRVFFPDSSNSPSHPFILFGVLCWSHFLRTRHHDERIMCPIPLLDDNHIHLQLFLVAKTCPNRCSTTINTYATFSGCKNVPASIFDDSFTLLQFCQVAKTCPHRFLMTVSHFCNFIRLQKRARVDF